MNNFNQTPVLILAAGKSSRAGMHKGLIPYQGQTWLEYQLKCLKNIGLHNISIVVSPQTQVAYQKMIDAYQVQMILNEKLDAEKFDSVLVGLQNISDSHVFIIPIDVPVADLSVWKNLLNSFDEVSFEARLPEFKSRGGHPVLLKKSLVQKILMDQKKTYQRLDHWLQNSNVERVIVEDTKVTQNLNHFSDYEN